jgi:hypothetical protein
MATNPDPCAQNPILPLSSPGGGEKPSGQIRANLNSLSIAAQLLTHPVFVMRARQEIASRERSAAYGCSFSMTGALEPLDAAAGQSCLNLAAARLRYIAGTAWSAKCYMNMRPLYQPHVFQTEAVA